MINRLCSPNSMGVPYLLLSTVFPSDSVEGGHEYYEIGNADDCIAHCAVSNHTGHQTGYCNRRVR